MTLSSNQLTVLSQEIDLALLKGALVQIEPAILKDLLATIDELKDENIDLMYRVKELEEQTEGECSDCEDFKDRAVTAEAALTDVTEHLRAILKVAA